MKKRNMGGPRYLLIAALSCLGLATLAGSALAKSCTRALILQTPNTTWYEGPGAEGRAQWDFRGDGRIYCRGACNWGEAGYPVAWQLGADGRIAIVWSRSGKVWESCAIDGSAGFAVDMKIGDWGVFTWSLF